MRPLPAALFAIFLLVPLVGLASPTPVSIVFTQGPLVGGGHMNDVAFHPWKNGVLLAAGNVNGVHLSDDWGASWRAANVGIDQKAGYGGYGIASLLIGPSDENGTAPVFAAGGKWKPTSLTDTTPGGNIYNATLSLVKGKWQLSNWTKQTKDTLSFMSESSEEAGIHYPVGRLLARQTTGLDAGTYYAATYDRGVWWLDSTGAWQPFNQFGSPRLRAIAISPETGGIYVAATTGIQRVIGAVFVPVGGPVAPTSLLALSAPDPTHPAQDRPFLYALNMSSTTRTHVWRLMLDDPLATWQEVGDGFEAASKPLRWQTLTGYRSASGVTLVAGAIKCSGNCDAAYSNKSLMMLQSQDGSSGTWTSMVSGSTHDLAVDGKAWAMATNEALPGGRSATATSFVAVGPGIDGAPEFLLAHTQAIWSAWRVPGTSTFTWRPLVQGMGATVVPNVAADPVTPGRAIVVLADYSAFTTANGFTNVSKQPIANAWRGYAASFVQDDVVNPSRGIVGNNNNEVYVSDAALSGWTSLGFAKRNEARCATSVTCATLCTAVDPCEDVIPVHVQARVVDQTLYVVVATETDGAWIGKQQASGATSWQRIGTGAPGDVFTASSYHTSALLWPAGNPYVFALDENKGLLRVDPTAIALVWELMYQDEADDNWYWNSLVADVDDPGKLYYSAAYPKPVTLRFNNTDQPIYPAPKALGGHGKITQAASGALYQARDDGLYRSENAASTLGTPIWERVTSPTFDNAAHYPNSMAVGADGRMYIGTYGNGMLVSVDPVP